MGDSHGNGGAHPPLTPAGGIPHPHPPCSSRGLAGAAQALAGEQLTPGEAAPLPPLLFLCSCLEKEKKKKPTHVHPPPGEQRVGHGQGRGAIAPPPLSISLLFIIHPPNLQTVSRGGFGSPRPPGPGAVAGDGRGGGGRAAPSRSPRRLPRAKAAAGRGLSPAAPPFCKLLPPLRQGLLYFIYLFFLAKGKIYVERVGKKKKRKSGRQPPPLLLVVPSTPHQKAIASARQFFTKVLQPLD